MRSTITERAPSFESRRVLLICDYPPEQLDAISRTLTAAEITDRVVLRKRGRAGWRDEYSVVCNLPFATHSEEVPPTLGSLLSLLAYVTLATAWGIILVVEKKCDSVMAIFAFPQGIVASLIGKITGKRVDVLTDGGDVEIIMKNGLARPSILASLKHAHRVVALNPIKARQLLTFGVISEVNPCIGIDISRFVYTPFENKERSSILYVGRLSNEKRPQILIRACRKLRARGVNFRLTLVGDGPLREEVTRMVSDMGLDEMIIVRGHVPHEEIGKFYSKCGIFVLPSVREGVSVALLEALSSGCLCIVSDIDDNIEVMSRGRGITFRTDDEDDLVAALLWALQQPSSTISNITSKAREIIEGHYSLDAVGSTLKAILL